MFQDNAPTLLRTDAYHIPKVSPRLCANIPTVSPTCKVRNNKGRNTIKHVIHSKILTLRLCKKDQHTKIAGRQWLYFSTNMLRFRIERQERIDSIFHLVGIFEKNRFRKEERRRKDIFLVGQPSNAFNMGIVHRKKKAFPKRLCGCLCETNRIKSKSKRQFRGIR